MEKRELQAQKETYQVIVTVVGQKGKCLAGHQVGDKVIYKGLNVEGYVCPSAFAVLYRYMYAMRFGAKFPYGDSEQNTIRIACPDPNNPVVFELKTENL